MNLWIERALSISRLTMVGIAMTFSVAVCAQSAPANSAVNGQQPQPRFVISGEIQFDAATQGPLLQVRTPIYSPLGYADIPPDAASVAAHVDKLHLRVAPLGSLTVLAPTSMVVIEENPGKPDPYSGLRAEERLKVLMAMFTPDQWRKAGSADGIGVGDMTDQERSLFLGLLPDKVIVQRAKLVAGDQPHSIKYDYQGDAQQFAPEDVHLRFVRQVQFDFMKPGSEDTSASGGPSDEAGEEKVILQSHQVSGDVKDAHAVTAYGVPVLTVQPNRLKPGQLDFASGVLQRAIPIDESADTVGDLLAQVARATGLDLVADRRLAHYQVAWRVAPEQAVRAGDILKALCLSVTGAFRQLAAPGAAPIYLLTDDVHGIGARIARLDEWAEAADSARREALSKVVDATAASDPLSHIQFAPDDPLALPPALQQRMDAAYRSARYTPGPVVTPAELPAAMQGAVEEAMRFWDDHNVSVRADRLRIDTRLRIEYKLPGDLVTEAPFSQNLDSQYLQAVAALPGKNRPAPAKTNSASAPPQPMPESLHRRVALAPLPEQAQATTDLLIAAKGAGFNEVWLHVMLNDPAAPERLRRAVRTGKTLGLAVGCAASLLHGGGMPGLDDLNIVGETGTEYSTRKSAEAPQSADFYRHYAGWRVMDPDRASQLLLPLARIPGLSALTLRATVAPGWGGGTPGSDGLSYNGRLGYTIGSRLACLRTEGFDPIDVAAYSYALGVILELPMFQSYEQTPNSRNVSRHDFWKELCDYRLRENQRAMKQIYAALRDAAPDLPLYLDDRASAYTRTNTSWYALWDFAEHIPSNPVFAVDSEVRAAAFAISPEPLINRFGWNGEPTDLARALAYTAQDAAKWRGLTFDLCGLKTTDAQRILAGLRALYSQAPKR
jgi:hypothetical protein